MVVAAREPSDSQEPSEPREPSDIQKPSESRETGDSGTARWWRSILPGRREDFLATGLYVVLGAVVTGRYWVDIDGRISAHLPIDQTWFEWLLAHGAYSVGSLENPLFSLRQNAPDGVNMMANTSALGITIPMAPITLLFGTQVAYVLWITGALAATAATSYWMLSRHLVASRTAAIVGGAFLGFAPGLVHHANDQPNFLSNFLLPLIVVRVLRLGEPGRWLRNGTILGLLVTYQVFVNEEMLLLTALGCAVAVLAYSVQRWSDARAKSRTFLAALAVAGGIALILTAYPIWFQFNGPQSYRGLLGGAYHRWGEDLMAYVTFSRDTLAGSAEVERTIGRTEQNTWFGWPLVVLIVVAIVLLWRRSLAARIATAVGVVFAFFSVGPRLRFGGRLTGVNGPWAAIPDDLPMVEMMMPSRLSFVVVAAVGVLIAVAWDRVAAAGHRLRPIGYAVLALALIPLVPTPIPVGSVADPPRFITSGGWRPYVPAGSTPVPVPIPSNTLGLETLRWSAETLHAFPVPGGYFIGPGTNGEGMFGAPQRPTTALIYAVARTGRVPAIDATRRQQAVADLRYWKASVVVLGPHPREEQLRALMTGLLGEGQRVDDVWLWDVRGLIGPP